jgi:hypothetical protein
MQHDEHSSEAQKISSASVIYGKRQAGDLSVTIASLGQPASDTLIEARSAFGRRDYATAQRFFEACDRKEVVAAIEEALLALDHRDYATAQRLFEALERKGFAASEVKESRPATVASPEPAGLGAGPMVASDSEAQLKPVTSPAPFVDVGFRLRLPQARKPKGRGLGQPFGVGLALSVACGAVAVLGPPSDWRSAVEPAIGGLASAISAHKAPDAIALQTAGEEQPSVMNDHDALLPTTLAPSGASRLQTGGGSGDELAARMSSALLGDPAVIGRPRT